MKNSLLNLELNELEIDDNLKKKLSRLSLLFKMFCLILSFMNEAGHMLQGNFSFDEMLQI